MMEGHRAVLASGKEGKSMASLTLEQVLHLAAQLRRLPTAWLWAT